MALGFYFVNIDFTPEKYKTAIARLESAGAGAPKGRSLHVALESNGEIHVFDIWESQKDFEAFGPILIPILTGARGQSDGADGHARAQRDQGLITLPGACRGARRRRERPHCADAPEAGDRAAHAETTRT
jgi:hypothetical protein